MKRILFFLTGLLILCQQLYATDYDFVATSPSGHTLFYKVVYGNEVWVVRSPGIQGDLIIPSQVSNNGIFYSVKRIDESAFSNNQGLTSVVIPNTVEIIYIRAFEGCSNLTSVSLPSSLVGIYTYAFASSGIDSLIIPSSVTEIYESAFQYCRSLSYITVDPENTTYDSRNECNALIKTSNNKLILGCANTVIPNSVTQLGECAFNLCEGLQEIEIPSSILSIPNNIFERCTNLRKVVVSSSVISIGSYAFYQCSLDSLIMLSPTPPILDGTVFTAPVSVYVPCGSYQVYQNSWGTNYCTFYEPESDLQLSLSENNSMYGTASFIQHNGSNVSCSDSTSVITAVANYGYHFSQWSDGIVSNPRIVQLTSDTSIVAMFEPNQYAVTGVPSFDVYGMVSGSDTVDYLDSVTLTAVANYGYHFTQWNDNSVENPRKVAATDNISMTAYFDYTQYTITLAPDTTIHGTVSGAGTYNYLSERTISATANYGYHFTQWSDGVTDNPRTLTLTQDTAFTAMFEPNQYAVTGVPSFDVYGMVSGSDTVDYLDTVILTATPNYGYQFHYWYRDGYYGSVQTNPMQVVANGNINYTAYFTPMVYTVGTQAEHGSIYISGSHQYQTQVSLTVSPDYGYHFAQWSDGVTDNPRTFTITQDTSFTALFEHNEYTLAFQSEDTTKGVVTVVSVSGLYLDTTPYVTAAALPHYHFTQWNDGSTENPRRFVFDGDHTYTASFAIDVHTVGVQVDHLAHGTVSGAGSREYGQPITVSATAYSGYQFTHWSDGSTYNPYTFAVLEDKDLTAIFVADGEPWQDTVVLYDTAYVLLHDTTYLNVMVHDTTVVRDTTYIDVPYAVHDTTYITLTDTVTNTVYDTVDNYIYDTVTVTDTLWLTRTDTLWLHDTVTVHDTVYVTGEGIDDAEALNAKVYSSHGQVVVEGAEGNTVALYDVNGRLLATKQDDYGMALHFDVTASGTYMIKIGHYPARKVVVIR